MNSFRWASNITCNLRKWSRKL